MTVITLEEIYSRLKQELYSELLKRQLLDRSFKVECKSIEGEQALGHPCDSDYFLIQGKERLIQADFEGCVGQAHSDCKGTRNYSLREFLDMPVEQNWQRADFVAGLNAIYKYCQLANRTIHCRDHDLRRCGEAILDRIHPKHKVLLIGFQPRLVQSLVERQEVRIIDCNPENIWEEHFGVMIEHQAEMKNALGWCDIVLAKGSTLVNGTIPTLLNCSKPVVFYGVTIAAPAKILGLKSYCAYGY